VERSEKSDSQRMLRSVGLKSTRPRARVLEALLKAEEPLSHRELMQEPGCRGLDRVSVYRALRAFVEKGLAYRLVTEDRVGRFVASSRARSHPRHPHFLCRRCGKLECLTRIRMPTLTPRRIGHRVEKQSWLLEGVCTACLSE